MEETVYDDPLERPATDAGLLAATDPRHEFADGRCVVCGCWQDRGYVSCRELDPVMALAEWLEVIGARYRRQGNASPIQSRPAPAKPSGPPTLF